MRHPLAFATAALFALATPAFAQSFEDGAPGVGVAMTSAPGLRARSDGGADRRRSWNARRDSHQGVGDGRGLNGHNNVGGPGDF